MPSTAALLTAAALTIACAGRSPAQEVEAAVVVAVECGSAFYMGTGVAVSPDRVLTALHVVTCEHGEDPTIGVYQGELDMTSRMPRARIEVVLPRLDAARLVVEDGDLDSSPVDVGPRPRVGDPDLTVVTADPLWQVKRCVVQPTQPMGSSAEPANVRLPELRVMVGCDVEPGNSGGAAYDSRGRLVGLVSWTVRSSEFGGLVPLQDVPWITRAP